MVVSRPADSPLDRLATIPALFFIRIASNKLTELTEQKAAEVLDVLGFDHSKYATMSDAELVDAHAETLALSKCFAKQLIIHLSHDVEAANAKIGDAMTLPAKEIVRRMKGGRDRFERRKSPTLAQLAALTVCAGADELMIKRAWADRARGADQ